MNLVKSKLHNQLQSELLNAVLAMKLALKEMANFVPHMTYLMM